ncbi:MAG: glycogen-binding domain-containing protein [Bacteroidetes bacterium]|nr:glycogen-binding domain-containing protein [Bacteroidota bacterium]
MAGSFNNWNEKELAMQKTATGWELNLYLKEGTHTYKYIADREWMLDPGNPLARPDGKGNINSVMSLGEPHYFVLDGYLDAKIVMLTGSFNNWNAGELIMENGNRLANFLCITFRNYEYKFIVDGQWITDPKNQCKSLLEENVNSCIVISANHLFSLNNFPQAKRSIYYGSFCNWAEPGYKMMNDNGVWIFLVICLPENIPTNLLLTASGFLTQTIPIPNKTNMAEATPFCGFLRMKSFLEK